ncbi:gamma-glutamylcyclotransferase family protein [Dyadobacter frigoris]|uniref:Gamma-glutamylcyclotransferase n=1 Tax=Dyadobacter frigoris TaxID=2576211 RepID=A0A4U6D908_9BACT|nr:gamma-glutamylcyclotransferase family protein [Dyadobacter frigoris]TKT93990.1 gamma-glutamylcyclotransferase [Dyadobacter frigoris]GLU50788.1 gamma-glutamylcyclotransferase [Dyadobacter frigoris]
MTSDAVFLFTYGTLMQGFSNPFAQRLHTLSTFEGKGSFPGTLYKIDWYPGAVYDTENQNRIYGEVYKIMVPEILFPELDEYEDVFEDEEKSLYMRKIIPVLMNNGVLIDCWTYIYNQDITNIEIIKSGDFRHANF